jgi:hypothetical protein
MSDFWNASRGGAVFHVETESPEERWCAMQREQNEKEMSGMTLYKTLNGTAGAYGWGDYSDYMPHGKRPGKWLPPVKPVLCESGYHYCRDLQEVLTHAGPVLVEVEVRGEIVAGDDKAAAESLRLLRVVPEWHETNLRLFAVDCARLALPYADAESRELLSACLDVTTAYALGYVDVAAGAAAYAAADAAACAAACAAAYAAARAAADVAAYAAADAAARDAARVAADVAACVAADAAARDAAYAAARDAAYAAADAAARAAAYAAAGAAARAAASAAVYVAAYAAAYAAAGAAARAAARDAQTALLSRYLAGEQGPLV